MPRRSPQLARLSRAEPGKAGAAPRVKLRLAGRPGALPVAGASVHRRGPYRRTDAMTLAAAVIGVIVGLGLGAFATARMKPGPACLALLLYSWTVAVIIVATAHG